MKNEWTVAHSGSVIRLVNSWFGGCKLYIDGELKDFDKSMLATAKHAVLSGAIVDDRGRRSIIEVFAKSNLLTVEFRILSNGDEILHCR